MSTDDRLFIQPNLHSVLKSNLGRAQKEVDAVSKEQFQASTDEQIIEYIFSKLEIVPLTILADGAFASEPQEFRFSQTNILGDRITPSGISLEISIPFTGEKDLWKFQPSMFSLGASPRGEIITDRQNDNAGVLRFTLEFTTEEYKPDYVNQKIEQYIESITMYLGWVRNDVEKFNRELLNIIRGLVPERRKKLGGYENVNKFLKIPIRKQASAPDVTSLPISRKIIKPLPNRANLPPEYTIADQDYEYILKIIRHEGRSYERTPATFSVHDEEELRDILLAHLNSHFEGQATGETFRKKGKTDICIEFQNRAAFVSEIKLWKGEKILLEAVSQLLSYLTWRDCKTALVVFNKEVAGFKQIQEKIVPILQRHPNFMRQTPPKENGEWSIFFRSLDDAERLVIVHVFLFNLFASPV